MLLSLLFFFTLSNQVGADVVFLNVCVNSSAFRNNRKDTWVAEAVTLDAAIQKTVAVRHKPVIFKQCFSKNATRENCLAGLKWVTTTANEKSFALIYISAHGGYNEKGFYCEMADTHLLGSDIKAAIGQLRCPTLFIMDTCHSGKIIEDWGDAKNFILFSTCKKEETAYVWKWVPHFIDALSKADYNNDNLVDTDEVACYLSKHVTAQTPVFEKKFKIVLTEKYNQKWWEPLYNKWRVCWGTICKCFTILSP